MDKRSLDILLVEDNPGDARLISEGFQEVHTPHRLVHVEDGEQALAYLRRQEPFWNVRRPALILLDLNLPRRDGRALLADIKSSTQLRSIPVVVLTSSDSLEDIQLAYDLSANCFVNKPLDLEQYLETIRIIHSFWCETVQLPVA